MARPTKKGLNYFPFDTTMDKKMNLIMRRFGRDGYYIITRLMCDIYREEGYFCHWNDTEAEFFSVVEDIEVDFLKECINFALCIGLYDKNIYETYGMLTSEHIQEVYFEAVGRRKNVFADERILLIDIDKYCKLRTYAEKTDLEEVNVDINPQIKENKNKEKENKEKESISNQTKSNQKKSEKTKTKHSASEQTNDAEYDILNDDIKNNSGYDCLNDDIKNDSTKDCLSEDFKDNAFVTLRIRQSFEENIGIITPDILCELLDLVKKYGESAVYNAIDEAVKNDVRSMLGVGWYAEKDASNYMVI